MEPNDAVDAIGRSSLRKIRIRLRLFAGRAGDGGRGIASLARLASIDATATDRSRRSRMPAEFLAGRPGVDFSFRVNDIRA